MLGEVISEEKGQNTSQRVLPAEPGQMPKMETSFRSAGKVLGLEAMNVGTYTATMRPDGTLVGGGQGVMMGPKGESMTWIAQGVGTIDQNGEVSYRGSLMYTTASEAWLRLNRIAGVFEYTVKPDGTTVGKTWEWK